MSLGIKATTGAVIVGNRNGLWCTRTVPEEDSEGKMGPKQSGDDSGASVA